MGPTPVVFEIVSKLVPRAITFVAAIVTLLVESIRIPIPPAPLPIAVTLRSFASTMPPPFATPAPIDPVAQQTLLRSTVDSANMQAAPEVAPA